MSITIIATKDRQVLDLADVTEVLLLEESWDFPHWGWFIFWGIMLLPIGVLGPLVVGLFRRQYVCAIKFKKSKRLFTFNKKNYRLLQLNDSGF
jgi:hypothetical protein